MSGIREMRDMPVEVVLRLAVFLGQIHRHSRILQNGPRNDKLVSGGHPGPDDPQGSIPQPFDGVAESPVGVGLYYGAAQVLESGSPVWEGRGSVVECRRRTF